VEVINDRPVHGLAGRHLRINARRIVRAVRSGGPLRRAEKTTAPGFSC
jgi:hypothetical protein